MDGHSINQSRELSLTAALGALLSILAGCGALGFTESPEGVDGPYFGDAVSAAGTGALVGSPGGAGGHSPGLAYVFERTSEGCIQKAALSAQGGKPGNEFGSAVAFSEATALVGAWGTDGVAPVSGSAYVFERGTAGWNQVAVLVNPDAAERHLLGFSVALEESTAVVGAPHVNMKLPRDTTKTVPAWSGAVYVWSRDERGWWYQGTITPDSPRSEPDPSVRPRAYHLWKEFGHAVAIHGDILAVAAQDGTTDPGTVYVFRRVNGAWTQEAKLEQHQPSFGIAIAVSNETVAVASAGSVFVFVHTDGDWRLQARVEPHVAGEDAGFQDGGAVSLDGNLMVIGAARYKDGKGAAIVFERVGSDWRQIAMIVAEDTRSSSVFGGRAGDLFGRSVSIHGEDIVVGASFHDSAGPNYGAAYMYRREGSRWLQTSKLVPRIPKDLSVKSQ